MWFKSFRFRLRYSQNAGNAISETQNSKSFLGGMPPDPQKMLSLLPKKNYFELYSQRDFSMYCDKLRQAIKDRPVG